MPTYRASIVGGIWWPYGAICALDVGPFDEAREVERGALPANPTPDDLVSYIELHHAGDFSSVLDVEVWKITHQHQTDFDGRIIETTRRESLIHPFSEEAEQAYMDATSEQEPDD